MNSVLYEVDVDNFTLVTMSGEAYRVNVYDFITCCCWLPTSPLKFFESNGQLYCTNLDLDSTVRLA